VSIRNARPFAEDLSLDIQGFALVRHPSAVVNFYNEQLVREIYYPEVEALLKARTGAVRVVIFDHIVRNADRAWRKEEGVREYGRAVHNDYSRRRAGCAIAFPRVPRISSSIASRLTYGAQFAARFSPPRWPCATRKVSRRAT